LSADENKSAQGEVSVRQVQFRRLLDEENVLRVSFNLEHGQVDAFAVQLECSFSDGNWTPIVRYDTAHGLAHQDKMHPWKQKEKIEIPVSNFKEGLNFAIDDLLRNWKKYRRRYEEWLRQI
jgi:hypothetical protein